MGSYLSLVFIILAAACNAQMDALTHHWNISIFSKWGNVTSFWGDPAYTWVRKYTSDMSTRKKWFWKINYPVQLSDYWHWLKMEMIIYIAAALTYGYYFGPLLIINCTEHSKDVLLFENIIANFSIIGFTWNCTFSLFYNKLLLLKTWKKN